LIPLFHAFNALSVISFFGFGGYCLVSEAIRQSITCYAATLHMNKGQKLLKPAYDGHKGHAPIFEAVTRFEGRSAKTAKLPDLLGQTNAKTPWKGRLPRLIFVSDMGDALSTRGDFPFLKSDLMPAVTSEKGQQHTSQKGSQPSGVSQN
jgi:hypothetical protein